MLLRYSAALVLVITLRVHAQEGTAARGADSTVTSGLLPLVLPGSAMDAEQRVRQLVTSASREWSLVRSTGTTAVPAGAGARGVALLAPFVGITHNTELPFSMNDGSQWAGRGTSYRIIAGAAATLGPLHFVIAPELTATQNRHVAVIGSGDSTRSQFASPWRSGPYSADLPLRFGNAPLRMLTAGQSRIELRHDAIAGGASTEDQWWGPGERNALVLSTNAPGIPHLYLRTTHPVRLPIGHVEARWLVGALTESIFFDRETANDLRSVSAAVATLRLAAEPGLTVGLARAVYATVDGGGAIPARLFDVLTQWGRPDDASATIGSSPREQIISLFGRWAFPANGLEVYGEWAKQQLPRSLRDLLVAPQSSQGYTLGIQVARPALGGLVRGHAEVTNLEQSATSFRGPVHSFYTSDRIPQGYTHRGQALGAAIGPGSSSQYLAVDFLRPSWTVGLLTGRIRWDEDAYYQQVTGRERYAHDVSLLTGARVGGTISRVALRAEIVRMHRLNYLFQNVDEGYIRDRTFDVYNTTLRLSAGMAP